MAEEAIVNTPVTPVVEAAPVAEVVAPVEVAPIAETPIVEAPQVEVKAEPVVEEAKPLLSPEPEEVKTEVAEKPVEKVEDALLPVFEFDLPENAKTDNPVFKSFTEKLGEFQKLHNVSHEAVQKFGQEMIDMQIENARKIAEEQNTSAWDWFKTRNTEWLENSKKDPSIGGDNWNSTLSSAQQAISLYGGNKTQQVETAKLLRDTGVENHPALLRFLSNITKIAAKEGTPVASQGAPAQKSGIAQAMYGKTSA